MRPWSSVLQQWALWLWDPPHPPAHPPKSVAFLTSSFHIKHHKYCPESWWMQRARMWPLSGAGCGLPAAQGTPPPHLGKQSPLINTLEILSSHSGLQAP